MKKVCYKVSLCENFSGKVVRHSLAYLTVHKLFVGDVPLNVNFVLKTPTVVVAANASTARKHQGYPLCVPLDFYKSPQIY